MLEIKELFASYTKDAVLKGLSLSFERGKVTTVIGKNGCGKSTLLRAITGAIQDCDGEIVLDGEDIRALSSLERSKRIAYLAQDKNIPDITVSRLVLCGRFPYLSYPRRYREGDYKTAQAAMDKMGISDIGEHKLSELSGGMRQKAYIAMALCQETDVILMDEPTTFLDISQQLLLCDTVRELANEDKSVVLVLHDILLAMKISDKIALIENGVAGFVGTPGEFALSGIPERVYGVHIRSIGNEFYYERI